MSIVVIVVVVSWEFIRWRNLPESSHEHEHEHAQSLNCGAGQGCCLMDEGRTRSEQQNGNYTMSYYEMMRSYLIYLNQWHDPSAMPYSIAYYVDLVHAGLSHQSPRISSVVW